MESRTKIFALESHQLLIKQNHHLNRQVETVSQRNKAQLSKSKSWMSQMRDSLVLHPTSWTTNEEGFTFKIAHRKYCYRELRLDSNLTIHVYPVQTLALAYRFRPVLTLLLNLSD